MLARLGNVLFWTGIIIAAAWVSLIWSLGGTALLANFGVDTLEGQAAVYLIPAVVAVGIGWAFKYILAGPGRGNRTNVALGIAVETGITITSVATFLAILYTIVSAIRHTGDPFVGALVVTALILVYFGLAELSFRF